MIGVAAIPIAIGGVLAVEVQLARGGPNLPDAPPLEHDGSIGSGDGPILRTVWLGDSTAAGVGAATAETALPRSVARALDQPVEVAALAVSGDRVGDVLADQVPLVAALEPDVILISVGANDVVHLTSRATFRSRYRRMIEALPADALIVVLGVPDMGAPGRFLQPLRGLAALRGRQLEGDARSVARASGAVYVDIAGETGPTMRADRHRYFAADRYHPSDDGYALWASAVLDQLRPALAERVASHAG